jgi:hypothetical protein
MRDAWALALSQGQDIISKGAVAPRLHSLISIVRKASRLKHHNNISIVVKKLAYESHILLRFKGSS